jgi:hypothetical protein
MGCEVLMEAKISLLVFWVVTSCGLAGRYNVSEEHTASIFSAKGSANLSHNTGWGENPASSPVSLSVTL